MTQVNDALTTSGEKPQCTPEPDAGRGKPGGSRRTFLKAASAGAAGAGAAGLGAARSHAATTHLAPGGDLAAAARALGEAGGGLLQLGPGGYIVNDLVVPMDVMIQGVGFRTQIKSAWNTNARVLGLAGGRTTQLRDLCVLAGNPAYTASVIEIRASEAWFPGGVRYIDNVVVDLESSLENRGRCIALVDDDGSGISWFKMADSLLRFAGDTAILMQVNDGWINGNAFKDVAVQDGRCVLRQEAGNKPCDGNIFRLYSNAEDEMRVFMVAAGSNNRYHLQTYDMGHIQHNPILENTGSGQYFIFESGDDRRRDRIRDTGTDNHYINDDGEELTAAGGFGIPWWLERSGEGTLDSWDRLTRLRVSDIAGEHFTLQSLAPQSPVSAPWFDAGLLMKNCKTTGLYRFGLVDMREGDFEAAIVADPTDQLGSGITDHFIVVHRNRKRDIDEVRDSGLPLDEAYHHFGVHLSHRRIDWIVDGTLLHEVTDASPGAAGPMMQVRSVGRPAEMQLIGKCRFRFYPRGPYNPANYP